MKFQDAIKMASIFMAHTGVDAFKASEVVATVFPEKSLEEIVDAIVDFRSKAV